MAIFIPLFADTLLPNACTHHRYTYITHIIICIVFRIYTQFNHTFAFICNDHERDILQNAKLLEKLHLSVCLCRVLLEGLHDILSPCTHFIILKTLISQYPYMKNPRISLFRYRFQAFARNRKRWRGLKTLSFEVNVDGYERQNLIGSIIQIVEKVLVKPGWTAL